jgi:hypothetical protein
MSGDFWAFAIPLAIQAVAWFVLGFVVGRWFF